MTTMMIHSNRNSNSVRGRWGSEASIKERTCEGDKSSGLAIRADGCPVLTMVGVEVDSMAVEVTTAMIFENGWLMGECDR